MSKCYKFGEILLPKNADVKNWAVVACDQYTSDPGYWKKIEESVTDPTALRLIFPDIHVARNAGCYAVGVDWGYHDPADFAAEGWEPDLLVSDPEQILALAPEA